MGQRHPLLWEKQRRERCWAIRNAISQFPHVLAESDASRGIGADRLSCCDDIAQRPCAQSRERNILVAIELKGQTPLQGGTPWHAQLHIPIIDASRAKTFTEPRSMELMAATSVRSIISSLTSCPDAWPTPS